MGLAQWSYAAEENPVANPWSDPLKAKAWTPHGKAGNVQRDLQIEVALRLVAAHGPRRVLDLGCGMGDIDAALLARCPEAELVCLDGSAVMLERTRSTLAENAARVRLVEADLEAPWEAQTGDGFDVVFSSQAVHHVPGAAKRAIFARALGVLRPGGLFLLNDRVAFSGAFWPHMVALWDRARAGGGFGPFGRCEDHASYVIEEAAGGDLPDPLDSQLAWLRQVGFDPVECFWRDADHAIFGGLKPL